MSNRAQVLLGFATGTAIDTALYAGALAAGIAALVASVGVLLWRSR